MYITNIPLNCSQRTAELLVSVVAGFSWVLGMLALGVVTGFGEGVAQPSSGLRELVGEGGGGADGD